ncbi:PP2C family protein-serine/threonine phosphatase [Chondromyces apiculatus]|uniref:Protein serine/threonine phosphatase PrpC, regulation of stationary phase n=1 Tax=Chondromyces apiculatus DSM 436 TaxID=1192034 RepID=A0A017T001_9BACT|nr:protein phosphatase 2C domain-containing protein [Chondromyces apiculatus]EYF02528.1 Protein serine/threonine phosphatase PrpC, regulation of stationary phase [Chondromyces apiculatus DSM 436]
MGSRLHFEAAAGTHIGPVRRKNDDSFAALPELGLFMVADGIGGRPGGDIASRMAVDTVRTCFEEDDPDETWPYAIEPTQEREQLQFIHAVRTANNAIFERAVRTPTLRGMGTTFTGVYVRGERAFVAHVGDTRGYRLRRGQLDLLTDDHSVLGEARRYGVLLDDSVDDRLAGILMRSVGTERRVDVDTRVEVLDPGDVLLLCSDGLWEPVDEADLRATLASDDTPDDMVTRLIHHALERGTTDNVTCVVVRVA